MLYRCTPPQILPLESRRLLAASYPTNAEQYLLELINRGRANPTAEAARYGIDLNEGLTAGTISTAPKQPLAISPFLVTSARGHSQWMIDTDTFSHTGINGTDPGDRMTNAGYAFTGSWTWGENIGWSGSTGSIDLNSTTAQIHRDLFVDSTVTGRGHRLNLMSNSFREIGPGVVTGNFSGYNAVMVTEDFATTGSNVFLTGVAYTAPYGWDGRNATLQNQSRGAIVSPLEMHAAREPTKRELDALAEFQKSLVEPAAAPGKDFDPVRAARGEALFRTPRPIVDPTGEFPSGARVACATCHSGPFFTDGKAHRDFVPTGDPVFDPGHVGPDGTILGFDTPSLLGARFTAPYFHDGVAGDPTAPSNFLGGGVGAGSADGNIGASGPAAARRALLDNVLPFYNTVRFNFGFTQDELRDIAEFILSL